MWTIQLCLEVKAKTKFGLVEYNTTEHNTLISLYLDCGGDKCAFIKIPMVLPNTDSLWSRDFFAGFTSKRNKKKNAILDYRLQQQILQILCNVYRAFENDYSTRAFEHLRRCNLPIY